MTRRRIPPAAVAAAAVLAAGGVAAQVNVTELSLQTSLRATDRSTASLARDDGSELVLSLRPGIRLDRRGAGLRVSGFASADVVTSTDEVRRDRVLPAALFDASATLVERLLTLDAGVEVRQVEKDPFGARVDPQADLDARTAGSLRIAPRLRREFGPDAILEASTETIATRVRGTDDGDLTTHVGLIQFERRPRPFGGSVRWRREQTGARGEAASDLRVDDVSAAVLFAPDVDWVVGARAGRERSEIAGEGANAPLFGAQVLWSPGPRTDVVGTVDRRFFGTGWNLAARHRTPYLSFRLQFVREPVNAGSGNRAPGIEPFLDAILTTRYPEDAERSALVRDLVATRGLSGFFRGASAPAANYPQLRSSGSFSAVYLSPRTTLDATVYAERRVRLVQRDDEALANGVADTHQQGAWVGWNRRLSPLVSLNLGAGVSRIVSLAAGSADRTSESSARFGFVNRLAPRTSLTASLVTAQVRSNVVAVGDSRETSVAVELGHRF